MRRALPLLLAGVGLALSGACGTDAGVPTPAAAPGPTPGACASPTSVALTVKNYLSWCSVSVAGRSPSTALAQTFCVAPGPVALSATPLPGFELGPTPWHDTDRDRGAGDPGTLVGPASATTVTAAGTTSCAWACCPLASGTGCPNADQCP